MTPAMVEYLIARDRLPARSGLAYDYILAGDGLYLATENHYMEARVPVASARVRGLPPIYQSFALRAGRIPQALWDATVFLAGFWSARGREVLLTVALDVDGRYGLRVPSQIVGSERVIYRPSTGEVLQIHSHHRYAARFSPTDDADEGRLCLYGVLGRLDAERPEVALRVGAYGHFLPVQWEAVFEGDRGVFRDVNVEPHEPQMEEADELPD
jgi:PRTRC genetic system protein A